MSEHARHPGDHLESREDFEAAECRATCPAYRALATVAERAKTELMYLIQQNNCREGGSVVRAYNDLRSELERERREKGEAISVGERHPPTGIIMVWPNSGGWETVFYDADDNCVNSGEWFGPIEKTCLYWMPLPPPPAELASAARSWPRDWPRYKQACFGSWEDCCDMLVGPCCCGASHEPGEFEYRDNQLYRYGQPVSSL